MKEWKFTLSRQRKSHASGKKGALGLDKQGKQRMLMLGIHHR